MMVLLVVFGGFAGAWALGTAVAIVEDAIRNGGFK